MTIRPKRAQKPTASSNTGDMEPDIIRGALNNDMDEVQAALHRNPRDINKQHDFYGTTALHIASGYGNIKMVEFLLLQPRLRFLKDRWDRDPLDVAIAAGHPLLTNALFEFRARKLKLAGRRLQKSKSPANVVQLKP